ncbi:MAG TPA: GntR family transcriptional regulator [Saliniramus sp.]|nr:GntR family transcriptional regulator [Saliniramus sp.]
MKQIDTGAKAAQRPLYLAVEDALKEAVSSGSLLHGDILTEVVVSDVLRISRTPVKLAFDRLVDQGLMTKSDGRGFAILSPKHEASPGRPSHAGRRRIRREQLAALMASPPPKRSHATWTTIYDEVEREISGRSVFGPMRVVEAELASCYGVSRTVAHEVLMRMERLGIIEKDDRGRWSIVPMTPDRVRQIYEVRRLLEPTAIRAAAGRIPGDELEQMRARLKAVQDRYPEVNVVELDGLERDLHVSCIGYCGNPELVKLLRGIQALLIHNKHMLGSYLSLPQLDPFMGEHTIILEALSRRDGASAAQAMEAHLRSSLPNVLQRLDMLLAQEPTPQPSYLVAE